MHGVVEACLTLLRQDCNAVELSISTSSIGKRATAVQTATLLAWLLSATIGFIVGTCAGYVAARHKMHEALRETQAVLAGVADILGDIVDVLERLLVNNRKNG